MGLLKTSGIVTKTTKYGDTSLIVTMLTKDFGRISAIASGVRTKKSQMLAGLQLFAYSEIVMYKAKSKKGLYNLNEMTVTESFSSLRYDLDKMAYASYFAEAASGASAEDAPDEEILRLLLNTLYALDKQLCEYEKIKTVFEWRLAAEAGYAPLLTECAKCGKHKETAYLSFANGTALCAECGNGAEGMAKLSSTMAKIIKFICLADIKKIFSFEAGQATVGYLSRVSEEYLKAQLDRQFPTLDYLKKVKALEEGNEK